MAGINKKNTTKEIHPPGVCKIAINKIIPNPDNPRLVKDNKFKQLVKSITDFPEMLNLRPIVVNSDMMVLGGNMRLKACQEAGLKEVPVIVADSLSAEQQREFIVKDNLGGISKKIRCAFLPCCTSRIRM